MIQDIKKMLGRITPVQVAARELAEAELAILASRTAEEYAASVTSYNATKIKRLKVFIAAEMKAAEASA